ncbi:MAG: undecaprenyl-diphosphate phosphatase [Chloroflexi bacterium]|nr:MAG: undecaprenyl-diphosphate phosphatase [Chloroflexota bacterium]
MSILQAILLGFLQGATEFIPVSSSGHLVLVPWLLGWAPPPLAFDTTVHWGTLVAVFAVFWRDLWGLLRAWLISLRRRSLADPQARLAWAILLGSLPAALAGVLLGDFFERLFGQPIAAASFLLITALILTVSERVGRCRRPLWSIGGMDALLIGLAQAAAILPGISRSGATIATGLAREIEREAAARFSFLLSVPVILGAGLVKLLDLAQAGSLAAQAPTLLVGFLVAALTGYLAIRWLLAFLQRRPLYVFALYCAAFGLLNLVIALARGG